MKNLSFYDNDYLSKTVSITKSIKDRSYELLALKSGSIVVDLGCGNGHDTRMLSEIVGKPGKVIGIDHDSKMLEEAEKITHEKAIHNIQYIQADITKIPLEDQSCDAVRIERVFQHLKDPMRVMKEIHRILKPEGKIAIVETDWLGLHFYIPPIETEKKIIEYIINRKLNNGEASILLVDYLTKLKFQEIQMEVVPFIIQNYAVTEMFIKLEDLLNEIQHSNYIDKKDLEAWKKTLLTYDKIGCLKGSLNMLTVTAKKI